MLKSDAPSAAARAARLHAAPGFASRSAASVAPADALIGDFLRASEDGFFERDAEFLTDVAAVPRANSERAEEITEQPIQPKRTQVDEVERATALALPERGRSESVVGGPLLVVLEDLVSGVDLRETRLGRRIVEVSVRMVLHREAAKGGTNVALRRAPVHSQDFVRIPHGAPHSMGGTERRAPASGAPDLGRAVGWQSGRTRFRARDTPTPVATRDRPLALGERERYAPARCLRRTTGGASFARR